MLYLVSVRFDLNALMSADVAALSAAEADRVVAVHDEGKVLGVWRRADRTGAVIVLDVEPPEQIGDILMSFPLFPYLRDVEVTPLVAHPRLPEFGISRVTRPT